MDPNRRMVSYDDISLPYDGSEVSNHAPPPKKRKTGNQKAKAKAQKQRWDSDSPNTVPVVSSSATLAGSEDSRELSHNEIWDDSALIDAWDAAAEEYAAYHGPNKDWKKAEPKHKSALWYNRPPPQSQFASSDANGDLKASASDSNQNTEEDSQPVDFNTFIPNHNPSLDLPKLPYPTGQVPDYSSHFIPESLNTTVNQDEAFSRALGAMYWGGYWTAMYHAQRAISSRNEDLKNNYGEEDDNEDLMSTQR